MRTAALSAMLLPAAASAATNNATSTVFSNPLFNALLTVIILLAIVIIALGTSLRHLVSSELFIARLKEAKKARTGGALLIFFLIGSTLSAQNAKTAVTAVATIGGLEQPVFYTMISIIAAELLVLFVMARTFRKITGVQARKAPALRKAKPLLDKINKTVRIEDEASITLDHEYDGIRELDNDLPPWWKYGFYLTILVSVVYMVSYHVTGTLPLQVEEYKESVRRGEAEVAEFMKTSSNNVDETNVKLLSDPADLSAGKDLYITACAACHGRAGEGGVGPNLTDDYWMHSGGLSDIFKTIKYGWPDKGMKSWKDDFSPLQIAQITSFIKSLRGTNPPNGKEKQGDLYTEAPAAADSLAANADTLSRLTSQVLK